jgi:hypothetical protein
VETLRRIEIGKKEVMIGGYEERFPEHRPERIREILDRAVGYQV